MREANLIVGNDEANQLKGGGGADTLMGMGKDTLDGGAGDDVLEVEAGDVAIDTGGGIDLVLTGLTAYGLGAGIENLTYAGKKAFKGTGNELDNSIVGGRGADTLDGRAGADTLRGGKGDDVYLVDALDKIKEAADGGVDTIRTVLSHYELITGVEILIYDGSGSFTGKGGEGDDTIIGGALGDRLDGRGGSDVLKGGAGDDTYIFDDAFDHAVETAGGGVDLVLAYGAKATLDANVENLTNAGGGAFVGVGNNGKNVLRGGDSTDALDGGGGEDTLIGGKGNDTYLLDRNGDVIIETADGGDADEMRVTFSATIRKYVEKMVLVGDGDLNGFGGKSNDTIVAGNGNNKLVGAGGDDVLIGNFGDDTLNGGGGADTMNGGSSNDVYIVDSLDDVIVEAAAPFAGGIDTIRTNLKSYSLHDVVGVEKLTYTGRADVTFVCNDAGSAITTGRGADTLSSGDGADTLTGGRGADTYRDFDQTDTIVEEADAGLDLVWVSDFYTGNQFILPDNVENAILRSFYVTYTAFGNELDNRFQIHGQGALHVFGGAGADLFYATTTTPSVLWGEFGRGHLRSQP